MANRFFEVKTKERDGSLFPQCDVGYKILRPRRDDPGGGNDKYMIVECGEGTEPSKYKEEIYDYEDVVTTHIAWRLLVPADDPEWQPAEEENKGK
jgi:hypothetical protein